MVLSVLVGNGAQLCAMVGVTLSQHCTAFLQQHLSSPYYRSLRATRLPLTVKPRLARDSHDRMLDILRRVCNAHLVP